MATPLRPRLRLRLALLRGAPPTRGPPRQSPAPPPFPREGPGIGAAPQGLRPDSRTLSRGAPYKGMVGAERAAAAGRPRPSGPPPASGVAELRPSAGSPQRGGISSPRAAPESGETPLPASLPAARTPNFPFTRTQPKPSSASSPEFRRTSRIQTPKIHQETGVPLD